MKTELCGKTLIGGTALVIFLLEGNVAAALISMYIGFELLVGGYDDD